MKIDGEASIIEQQQFIELGHVCRVFHTLIVVLRCHVSGITLFSCSRANAQVLVLINPQYITYTSPTNNFDAISEILLLTYALAFIFTISMLEL